jgi:thiol-disulfide isomerase/thioredoxin
MYKKILGLTAALALAGCAANPAPTAPANPYAGLEPRAALAQCLTDQGVTLYVAWWCGPCQTQKALFDEAVSRLRIVECYPQNSMEENQVCRDGKFGTIPTWKFSDGSRFSSGMSLQELAARTGCPYVESAAKK